MARAGSAIDPALGRCVGSRGQCSGLHGVTVVARQGRWKAGIGAEVGRSVHPLHESAREGGPEPRETVPGWPQRSPGANGSEAGPGPSLPDKSRRGNPPPDECRGVTPDRRCVRATLGRRVDGALGQAHGGVELIRWRLDREGDQLPRGCDQVHPDLNVGGGGALPGRRRRRRRLVADRITRRASSITMQSPRPADGAGHAGRRHQRAMSERCGSARDQGAGIH